MDAEAEGTKIGDWIVVEIVNNRVVRQVYSVSDNLYWSTSTDSKSGRWEFVFDPEINKEDIDFIIKYLNGEVLSQDDFELIWSKSKL